MATPITFIIAEKAISGTTNAAYTGQYLKYWNEQLGETDVKIVAASAAQAVTDYAEALSYAKGDMAAAKFFSKSGTIADGAYIAVTVWVTTADGKELSTLGNSLNLGDLFTAGAIIAGGANPVGLVLAAASGVYYLYQSQDRNERISWDKFYHGYEKTAMDAFVNSKWSRADIDAYVRHINIFGGAQTLRWVLGSIENKKVINPDNELISTIQPNNYGVQSLKYVYGESGVPGLRSSEGDEILAEYQLKFINEAPEILLNKLKELEKQGKADVVSAYLHALTQLSPVVTLNPKYPVQDTKTIEGVGEDWIKVRTWLVLEAKLQAAFNYYGDLKNQPSDIADSFGGKEEYQNYIEFVKSIRATFGMDIDDKIFFMDDITNQSFVSSALSNAGAETHQVLFAGDGVGETLGGGALADVLIGNVGDDTLTGNNGDDILIGGAGNDILAGGAGADYLNGGKGNDIYQFTSGEINDTVVDADGLGQLLIDGMDVASFHFWKAADNTWYYTNAQQVVLWRATLTAEGHLILKSHTSPDRIQINHWREMEGNRLGIVLGEYNDQQGNDYTRLAGDNRPLIVHEEGYFDLDEKHAGKYYWNDWNNRNPNGVIINGKAQQNFDDIIFGKDGNENILGLGGNDALDGGLGNDIIEGGDGQDLLLGGGGSDTIKGGDGNDFILSNSRLIISERERPDDKWEMPEDGKEVIFAGTKWGVYYSKEGTEDSPLRVLSGASNTLMDQDDVNGDTIFGGNGDDYIIGGNKDDVINGDGYQLNLLGGIVYEVGNDTIHGGAGGDVIHGGHGDDVIHGDGIVKEGYLNTVVGSEHMRDIIDGGDGHDTISGDGGNDYITGGEGNDKIWGDQMGYDKAYNEGKDYLDEQYHGVDEIYGGNGNDQIVGGGKGDFLYGEAGDDHIWGDSLDGTGHKELNRNDYIWGGAGNDYLDGGYGTDTIYGGTEDDQIWGGAGSDFLYGEEGNDVISGDDKISPVEDHGVDIIDGGEGNDELIGGGKGDFLYGGDGDDKLFGDDSQQPHEQSPDISGQDHLEGGKGNDYLDGGFDNDILDGGEGNDNMFGGAGKDYLYGGDGEDILNGDIGQDELLDLSQDHGDFLFGGKGNDQLVGGAGNDVLYGEEGDDKMWGDLGVTPEKASALIAGNDILYGGAGNDYMDGGYGDDMLYGGSDNDTIFGNFGNDLIYGDSGDDVLMGDDGDDIVWGGAGNDYLAGGNGSGTGTGNDILVGGDGNDTLNGEDGDDLLIGGEGNDKYLYQANGGVDTIDNTGGGNDGVFFNDIAADRISFHRDQDDLVILVDQDLRQQVRVKDHFLGSDKAISYVQPGSGYSITQAQIVTKLTALPDGSGTPTGPTEPANPTNPDSGNSSDQAQTINGTDGDDTLRGGAGNDTLNGGTGNDTLLGGAGNDTYAFNASFGQDTIDNTGGGNDTIYFDGIGFNQVGSGLTKMNDDLILKVSGTSDQVTITDWFKGGDKTVQTIAFASGGSISADQIFGAFGMSNPNATAGRSAANTANSVNSMINAMSAFGSGNGVDGIGSSDGTSGINPNLYLGSSSFG